MGSLVGFELDGIALDGSLRCTNGDSVGTKVGEVELDGAMLGCSVVIQEGLLVGVSVERTVGAALGLMLDGESVG